MTDQSSTGSDDAAASFPAFDPDGLAHIDENTAENSAENTDGHAAEDSHENTESGTTGHGPMVSDAAIDWSKLSDGGAVPGVPTDPQPTDGDAPAP